MPEQIPGPLSAVKRAYVALEQMQARLESSERLKREPVAIIGLSCRFPGKADNPESFWRILREGRDATGEVPPGRWNKQLWQALGLNESAKSSAVRGGFLENVDQFDAEFFGISPREAAALDPQQRLLLEVGWEALENAGQIRDRLAGSDAGVFVGITSHDYGQLYGADGNSQELDAYQITGNALNAAAGRLSYVFGFQGPSVAVDTACSSSLVAVHLACCSLKSGECSIALAGGVNLMLSPAASVALARARVLSPDGRCKAFDASADGMGRGEGCGVVVLKRLSDALRDNDNILALIAGTAINQDGPSSGLTVPNGPAQEALIRRALTAAGVTPDAVDYIEAHGTGTALGDPIEFGALASVFGRRSPGKPLHLGSVKTNIGHSEAAAGIAGLIKTVLSLQHSEIPPHLNFSRASPHLSWDRCSVNVPTAPTPWPSGPRPRIAGVSSFGFTGTNAHVVLREAQPPEAAEPESLRPRTDHLFVLSAASAPALEDLVGRYESYLEARPDVSLANVCFTVSTGRGHFEHRISAVVGSSTDLLRQLRRFTANPRQSSSRAAKKLRVAALFPDPSDDITNVSRNFVESELVFRQAIEECDRLRCRYSSVSLFDALYAEDSQKDDAVLRHFTAFAVQYAAARLWMSWGIEPAVLIGQGLGEIAAAVCAEVFDLSAAMELIASRAATLRTGVPQAVASVAAAGTRPTSSADAEQSKRPVRDINYRVPSRPLLSASAGVFTRSRFDSAQHWAAWIANTPATCVETIGQDWDVILEIGGLAAGSECRQMLSTLGELYVRGADVNWPVFWTNRTARRVPLPTYPFQRARHWLPEPSQTDTGRQPAPKSAGRESVHPLLGRRMQLAGGREIRYEVELSAGSPAFLQDHTVFDNVVFPAAAFLEVVHAAASYTFAAPEPVLRNISFLQPLMLSSDTVTTVQTVLTPSESDDYKAEIFSLADTGRDRWILHCSALISSGPKPHERDHPNLTAMQGDLSEPVSISLLYEQCRARGIDFGPAFRTLREVRRGEGEALGRVQCQDASPSSDYRLHPAVLDGCLQVLAAAGRDSQVQDTFLPLSAAEFHLRATVPTQLWSYCRIRPTPDPRPLGITADFWFFDDSGVQIGLLRGLELQRATSANMQALDETEWRDWIYRSDWQPSVTASDLLPSKRTSAIRTVRAVSPSEVEAPQDVNRACQAALDGLNHLATEYAIRALHNLGMEFSSGRQFTTRQEAVRIGIARRHQKQFNRILEMLAEDGVLLHSSERWTVLNIPAEVDPDIEATSLLSRFPEAANEIELVRRCGSRLREVLRGECDPLELLFADGSVVTAASLYSDSAGARAANAVVAQAVAAYVRAMPAERRLRILEVGAGTGGTTGAILPLLSSREVEYVFTDLSPAFLDSARQKFSSVPFLTYRTFDVEKAPSAQQFDCATFDIVIAANVLHATRDLAESVRNVRDLLAPSGMLLLLEGIAQLRFIDLIFGLTDGWWRFSDAALRPTHPTVSAHIWCSVLGQNGFRNAQAITTEQDGYFATQAVLIAESARTPEHWLLFSADSGVGESLAAELSRDGDLVTLVRQGPADRQCTEGDYRIDPANPVEYTRVIQEASAASGRPVGKVIHTWSADAVVADDYEAEQAARLACCSALYLVQALVRTLPRPPSLTLVTKGSQAVRQQGSVSGVFQAPLFAMGKTIVLEHPELSCVCVDLDPETSIDEQVRSLVHELYARDGEDQVAYEGPTRHVARLVRHTPALNDNVQFSANATYLITGGMSGLGRLTAEWMVDRGARHVALMSRTAAGETGAAWLQALRAHGANVTCFAADVSDAEQVQSVLNEVAATMPPLRGIVHSAGTLADAALLQQTGERFNHVFKAKIDGTWNLHSLSSRLPLDFFVLFSSAAAMLGSPAQANHTAANAFLDIVAHYRRSLGLPALSINWGAWSEVGSATSVALQSRLADSGMGTIGPSQGLKVLEYLMSSPMPQAGVVPIYWPEVLQRFPVGSEPPFYRSIAAAERRGATVVTRETHRGSVPRTKATHQSNSLQDYLAERVGAALRLDIAKVDVDKPMNHMGLDSLMAIEIRNRLKSDLSIEVPVVKFLDGLSIAELTQELDRTSRHSETQAYAQSANVDDNRSQPASLTEITPADAAGLLVRMDELSEEQLDALLSASLTRNGGHDHQPGVDIPQTAQVRVENNGRQRR